MSRWVAILLAVFAWAVPGLAHAQLFSPGKLAKGHAHLEGLDNCTKCHPQGGKLSPELCLDCHTALRPHVEAGKGLHGRPEVKAKSCEKCHTDHEGRAHDMIRFDAKGFDHREAGWVLAGAHARADCEACREVRLITSTLVKKRLRGKHKAKTFLGLSNRCAKCHFDEHRGQLSKDCKKCHGESEFAPAPKFDHAKAAFGLRGAHRKVDCEGCHPGEKDSTTPNGAFPKPLHADFARYRPIEHAQCTDCHEDPHKGRFGRRCTDCHSEVAWDRIKKKNLGKRGFHDKTRYPLEGRHQDVACEACHLPLGKRKQVFRGLPFDRCDRCHLDAHDGEVEGDCDACHDLEGFDVPRFGEEEHAKTDYPLEGAHRAVGCLGCHEEKRPPKPSRGLAKALKRRKRAFVVSGRALAPKARRCAECHEDVHRGQLDARVTKDGCEGCHRVQAWSEVTLDHAKQTRYPLTGKHAPAPCEGCHVAPKPGAPVRYRPVEQRCASCHLDAHVGQFAAADGKTDCARCHDTGGFEVKAFAHHETRFPLTGAHEAVECSKCHLSVEVGAARAARYRPLPTDCEGCHADYHQGAFARFTSAADAGCATCHAPEAWAPARFEHARVGWALEGRHAEARCASCHGANLSRALPRDCASCHRDPHRGELGIRCEGCHEQASWRSRYDADAHRASAFPLAGAHAVTPCEECHSDAFGRGFVRAAVGCAKCHADDYSQASLTSVDHAASGFGTDCLRCHNPIAFENGRFDAHETCFAIERGPHATTTCDSCHTNLAGTRVAGTCDTRTAACTGCHEHRREETDPEHGDVPGYQYEDRKCYECHQFAQR